MAFSTPLPPAPTTAATLIGPSGSAGTKSPTYSWNKVADATRYSLSVSGPSGYSFTNGYDSSAVCVGNTCSIANATPNLTAGNYTWKVQASNEGGNGPWSTEMAFSVAVPGKATLTAPSGSSGTNQPSYSWQAVTGSTWYLLRVNGPSGNVIQTWYTAAQAGCGSGTGTCSVAPSVTLNAGNYQWWVQTWNDVGYGPLSDPLSLSLAVPGKATLTAPSGSIVTNQPSYSWQAVNSSTWYLLWVTGSSGTVVIQTWYTAAQAGCGSGTGTCSVTPSVTLSAGNYQWWVQTWNGVGAGPWSTGMAFSTPPPPAATLIGPSGSAGTKSPTYSWNKVADATRYSLSVSGPSGYSFTNGYDSSAVCVGNTCSIANATPNLVAGDYTWKVQTSNEAGNGPWSTEMTFNVAVPGKATLTAPSGSSVTNQPSYSWQVVSSSTWYYLWVDGPSGNVIKQWYTAADAHCDASTCWVTPGVTLSAGNYSWSVQTWNGVGYGPWSDPMNFTAP